MCLFIINDFKVSLFFIFNLNKCILKDTNTMTITIQEAIKQFFEETKNNISQDFIDMFIEHYQNRDKKTNSLELYKTFK